MAERTGTVIHFPKERDSFLKPTIQIERSQLGYDHQLVEEEYMLLSQVQQFSKVETLKSRKIQTDTRTRHNFETVFAERFNLQVSEIEYEIRDNQIISKEHDEPFLDVVKRGQKHRQETGSRDVKREKAEVRGFEKVQRILASGETEPGQKIIVISPRGNSESLYQHNFFDVYQKVDNKVIMKRYLSKASLTEFTFAAKQVDPFNTLDRNPDDADFLSSPLTTYLSNEEITDLLKLDLEGMAKDEYEKLTKTLSDLKLNYLNALAQGEWKLAQKIFTAALNYADSIVVGTKDKFDSDAQATAQIAAIVDHYSALPVRIVRAGCGLQGKFATLNAPGFLSAMFPFSVSESADTSDFPCPRCGFTITYGSGIEECPLCHLEATCA